MSTKGICRASIFNITKLECQSILPMSVLVRLCYNKGNHIIPPILKIEWTSDKNVVQLEIIIKIVYLQHDDAI